MMGNVLAEVDMVEDILIHSDKCQLRELQKLEDETLKEINKTRKTTFKLSIWKFIKDENNLEKQLEGAEVSAPQGDSNENIVSQNPKINY